MPRRSKPLDANAGALQRMALDLRRLRDLAPAGRPLSVDDVADQDGVTTSRAAIYGALSATRLVSREALTAMVKAWAPQGPGKVDHEVWSSVIVRCGSRAWCRLAAAMLSWPLSRSRLIARLRRVAMTRGAFPVLTRDLSSW
jgi:hypothetical protein